MEKAKISSTQLFLLLVGFLFGSTVILSPTSAAKNDGWMAILIGAAGGTLLMGMYASIALLNPSKTLVEILRDRFGKFIGNVIAVFYVWYFIHLASLVLRNFGEFMVSATFIETPMAVIISILALVLVYEVNSGIEVMGRLSELFVPIIPVAIIIISLAIISIHDFTAFLPILENGMAPVVSATFSFISFPFGETVVFLMVFPCLNKNSNLKKVVWTSILVKVIISLFIFFRDISVLGGELTGQATFTPHLTALLIPEVNVEPLVDINLLIGAGIKISICIYAAAKALSQVVEIHDYKNLTSAITTFSVVLSLWVYENVLEMFEWVGKNLWFYYSIPFQIVIPLILLLLSLRKRKTSSNLKVKA